LALARLSIQPPSHFFPGPEIGKHFPFNRYWLARSWVAPSAAFPKPNRECSKITKLDAIAASHSIDDRSEDNVHDFSMSRWYRPGFLAAMRWMSSDSIIGRP
jgi:hypothetical protein